jgi:DNA-nicking Smr family endonuclease
MSAKAKPITNRSLSQLADAVSKAGIRLKPHDKQLPPAATEVRQAETKIPAEINEVSDEDAFISAMNGVHRASWRHDLHPSSKPMPAGPGDPAADPASEARRLMQAAVEQDSPIPIPDHPEYIEGWVGVAGKKFLPNLRNGLYSIQGQIDLHGLSRGEAQIAVEDYIMRMSRFRSCCIKIIHGRGINSPTDRATLKDALQRLLSTRRMSRYVVAYASAPSKDGGVGAVYVLLSKQ